MVYNYPYDSSYNPAMPFVELSVGRLRGQIELTLPALVDSGADATIIPIRYLQRIRVRQSEKKWMRGMAGGRYRVTLYPLFLQIGSQTMYVPVVGDELYDEVIVGRDVLNQMVVTLNGLANMVEVSSLIEAADDV